MPSYVRYVTQQGDRFDLISAKHYGSYYEFERIIAANPTVPIRPVLEAGLVLAIPVIDRAATPRADLLPPWKRP